MIFLVEYDRSQGRVIKFESFDDTKRSQAEEARLDLELLLKNRGTEHEVVLLDAMSEEALRQTHRRYFENLDGLTKLRQAAGS